MCNRKWHTCKVSLGRDGGLVLKAKRKEVQMREEVSGSPSGVGWPWHLAARGWGCHSEEGPRGSGDCAQAGSVGSQKCPVCSKSRGRASWGSWEREEMMMKSAWPSWAANWRERHQKNSSKGSKMPRGKKWLEKTMETLEKQKGAGGLQRWE